MTIDISQTESDEIFSDILFDYVEIKRPSASANPKGIILGGQPGSGKSFLKDEVILEFDESFIFISTDDLRLYHPAYLKLQQNPETVQNAANLVSLYASTWTERLIKHCIENKYNLIIDSTLGGNIKAVYDTIDMFRENSYQVHLRVMAVDSFISKLSIFLRYETQIAEKGFARWTRMEDHDDRFENLKINLLEIENNKKTDSIKFYERVLGASGTNQLRFLEGFTIKDLPKFEIEFSSEKPSFIRHKQMIKKMKSIRQMFERIKNLIQNRGGDIDEFEEHFKPKNYGK